MLWLIQNVHFQGPLARSQDRRLPHGLKLRKPSEEDDRKAVFGGEALAKVNKLNVRFDEGELEIEH